MNKSKNLREWEQILYSKFYKLKSLFRNLKLGKIFSYFIFLGRGVDIFDLPPEYHLTVS